MDVASNLNLLPIPYQWKGSKVITYNLGPNGWFLTSIPFPPIDQTKRIVPDKKWPGVPRMSNIPHINSRIIDTYL